MSRFRPVDREKCLTQGSSASGNSAARLIVNLRAQRELDDQESQHFDGCPVIRVIRFLGVREFAIQQFARASPLA